VGGRIEKENQAMTQMEKKLESLPNIFTLFYSICYVI
jgi:hypothetical protein